jgi:hypothetical protein
MAAAMRHGELPRQQAQASFEAARQAFAPAIAQRMPTTFRLIDDENEIAAFKQLLEEQLDA